LSINKCIYHLHLGLFPYRIDNQHDFKGCGENRLIMLHDKKGFFDLDPLVKMVPQRLMTISV